MIKLDTIGKILEGDHEGWYVKIHFDEKSGGFFVFQFRNKDARNQLGDAYDDWLQSMADVESYVVECNWKIEWLE